LRGSQINTLAPCVEEKKHGESARALPMPMRIRRPFSELIDGCSGVADQQIAKRET
jgi:hypothetical protein